MKTFYKFLFLIFLIGSSTTLKGFDDEEAAAAGFTHTALAEADSSSPRRVQATPAFKTPDQFLSYHQATVLRKEAFEEVVGIETVAQWDINWAALGRSDLSPHEAVKLQNISRLAKKVKVLARRNTDPSFHQLHGQVLQIKDRVEDIHLERLERVVKKSLLDKYSGAEVDFDIKEGGDQLGTIAFVRRPGEEALKFYVKTHSEGKLADKSSAAKRVNPGELLIYKILEELGIGSKTHFCARSAQDVYIVTLNAATGGRFFLFENAKEDAQGLGKTLWGEILGALHTSPQKNDVVAVENDLATDLTGQHFVQQTSTLDVLSRIGRLHDLLNNYQNFGFSQDPMMGLPLPRIIDFRIPAKDEILLNDTHFLGFLAGNGLFNYAWAHQAIRFGLHDRLQEKRVRTAQWVVGEGPLRDCEGAIERAFRSVASYLDENQIIFGDHSGPLMRDLEIYRDALLHNYRFFREKLETWHLDGQEAM